MSLLPNFLRHWLGRQDGNATVEFVIVLPFLFSLFMASVDTGVSMLRQAMLDRAVDIAVREVRLGRVPSDGSVTMAQLICDRTRFLPDCMNGISVEMEPIDTDTFDGLNDPIQCIDREQDIVPAVTFNAGAGGSAQELMLIRVCVAADPLFRMTGYVTSMPLNAQGQYVIVARSIFVKEPT